MIQPIRDLLYQYVNEIQKIYGSHLKQVILYGSYARGDFNEDSDVDIMILLDMSDIETKAYFDRLVDITFDFNMEYGLDIKPIAKSEAHLFAKLPQYYDMFAERPGILSDAEKGEF